MKSPLHLFFVALSFFSGVPSAQAQPSLSIARGSNQAVLIWPATAANYVLQSTSDLVSPDWQPVNDAVQVTVNDSINASVTNTGLARFFRLYNGNPPAGMTLIPAGSFTIGDTLDGETDAVPTTNVYVSAFYMDVNLVRYDQWLSVYNWATNHGYGLGNGLVTSPSFLGKAADHPVCFLNWFQAVKWCNARSQMGGLVPAYYTDAGLTHLYTNGQVAVYTDWTVNGYRLPTEAEWEKAARGGASGHRFPWTGVDYISEYLANYKATPTNNAGYKPYDFGPFVLPNGYNSAFTNGVLPNTSPVGYFSGNGYGLFDMAGNVLEWCWDWYQATPYPPGSPYLGGTDPHGPATGLAGQRVLRGGSWIRDATNERCAFRGTFDPTSVATALGGGYDGFGLRCVRAH